MPESSESAPPFFSIDTHCDTPTARLLRDGWDLGARHDRTADGSQVDLPRMREGGLDAMVFAVFTTQAARTAPGFALAHQQALAVFERTHAALALHPGQCGLALSAADGPRLKSEGRSAIYLSIENGYSLGHDTGNVENFHRLGVRMLGLNHMLHNDLADSSTDPRGPEWGGISPFGREVIEECNRLGLLLDASHASDDALWDLLDLSRAPVILSHSGCRAICDHPRNIGDELLQALAAQGGVIHINALPVAVVQVPEDGRTATQSEFMLRVKDMELTPRVRAQLAGEWERLSALHPRPGATLADYIRHIEHAVEVAGIEHVGIGCDFDGGGGVAGMDDVSEFPNLTQALRERGWSEPDLRKLWGENTLRVMRAAEREARSGEV